MTIIAKQLMRLPKMHILTILNKMIVKFTLIFLILIFANILCNKLVYINHVLKQDPNFMNTSVTMDNTNKGILINVYGRLKVRLAVIWVNSYRVVLTGNSVIIVNFPDKNDRQSH